MTTQQAIQHPNTDKLTTLAIGAILGLAMQHGIDLHEQVATLTQFLSSSEFHTAAMAVLVIFAKVKEGMKDQPQPLAAIAGLRSSPDIAAMVEAAVAKAINLQSFGTLSQVIQQPGAATQVAPAQPSSSAFTATSTATPPPVADNSARVS